MYKPNFQVQLPKEDTSFLYIPSPVNGYLNWKNIIIPKIVKANELNLSILYSLKSDNMFPLNVIYAKTENNTIEEFSIAKSFKGGIRQKYKENDYFIDDKFKIIAQSGNKTLEEFFKDVSKFPMNPSANAFLASDLTIERNEDNILNYLRSNGISNITEFEYYPSYYLYFLLTRFYSYPFSDVQLKLAKFRKDGNEIQKRFIDQVFELENPLPYVELLFKPNGEEAIKSYFDTSYDPSKWAKEYIQDSNQNKKDLNLNVYQTTSSLSDVLITWTDNQIQKYFRIELPNRETYSSRRLWIEAISGYIIATGVFGFEETPIFDDTNPYVSHPYRAYEDHQLLLA